MKNQHKWTETKWLQSDDGSWVVNAKAVHPVSHWIASLQIKYYSEAIAEHANGDLLDCGAGTAPFYGMYKNQTTSVKMTDWTNSVHESPYIDKLADLNKEIPYKNDSFDTILCADVLEHLLEPRVFFTEASRTLRTNGKLIVFVPYLYWLHEDPHDYHRYTKYALEAYCQDSDLKIIELKEYGGGPDVLIDISQKIFVNNRFLGRINRYFWRFFVKSKTYLRVKQRTIKKFPSGYVLVAAKISRKRG